MKSKWYFGTILLIFAYLGIFQEQISVPNQEIILQFTNDEVDHGGIKHTIDKVRVQLTKIGVTDIVIEETESSTLKISYYSVNDIDNIREALLGKHNLIVDQNSEDNENKGSLEYKIKVFEITDTSDLSNSNNKLVFENKYHLDPFTNDHSEFFAKQGNNSKVNLLFKVGFKTYRNNPFAKDHTTYNEPEIRAGPFTQIT